MKSEIDHLQLERQFCADAASATLPDDQLREFHSGHYTVKMSLCRNKKLYLFQAQGGVPTGIRTLRLVDVDFTLDNGFSVEMEGFPMPEATRVFSHEPRRVAPGVFVWLPRFTMAERYTYQGMLKSRVGVTIRSPHSPDRSLVDGHYYLVDDRRLDLITGKR